MEELPARKILGKLSLFSSRYRETGTVSIDVLDGLGYAIGNTNRENPVQILGTPVHLVGQLDIG